MTIRVWAGGKGLTHLVSFSAGAAGHNHILADDGGHSQRADRFEGNHGHVRRFVLCGAHSSSNIGVSSIRKAKEEEVERAENRVGCQVSGIRARFYAAE